MRRLLIAVFTVLCFAGIIPVHAKEEPGVRGEVFGKPVTEDEFNYFLKTATRFSREGKTSRTDEEIKKEAWEDIAYLREAKEEGVTVSDDEALEMVKKILAQVGLAPASQEYKDWVANNFGEDTAAFEKRMTDLALLDKFVKLKSDPQVTVTEDEIKQKFLNQYNSFESEYIKFDTRKEAEDFADKVKKNPILWKEMFDAKKPLGQKGSSWINIMSLEALIELWKIPKDDAYKIVTRKPGDFIVSDFFYGVAVFRLLNKREADLKELDEKKKKYFNDMLIAIKKQNMARGYFDNLMKRANYKDYIEEKDMSSKMDELKGESMVMLETNKGPIQIRLFPDVAPKTCENFVGLIQKGYYNNIIFHRVIKGFMIQGGDPTGTGTGGNSIWNKAFGDEVSDDVGFDRPGLLAMANAGPNTNKSQFFITTAPALWLNKKHTIFGEVISGYDVVQKIENTPTGPSDRPKEEQKILKAYIIK